MRPFLAAIALLAPAPALAWGQHYLMTDGSLAGVPWAAETVTVESAADFLAADPAGLARVFDGYYAWLGERGSPRFTPQKLEGDTLDAFLRAARLNPKATLPLAHRALPGGASVGAAVAPEAVSPYLHVKSPWLVATELVEPGTTMTARQVLATFADEPDWGFDHELWDIDAYGYGAQPYGKPTGESSKAPFHMLFAHENALVRAFAPEVLEGMVLDRTELFLRLSREAFATGHAYWGYRFAAWSAHYVQDLCQPYHAKAIPGAGLGYYLGFAVSSHKDEIKARTTTLSGNRHFLYEDYVAYATQQAPLEADPRYKALAASLAEGDATFDAGGAEALIGILSASSARHAKRIDRALRDAFGPRWTEDATVDVETDPVYSIVNELKTMDVKRGDRLLEESRNDFARTGRATRTIVTLARGK